MHFLLKQDRTVDSEGVRAWILIVNLLAILDKMGMMSLQAMHCFPRSSHFQKVVMEVFAPVVVPRDHYEGQTTGGISQARISTTKLIC